MLGTGQYLSPEQANGERGDERSDQYSLGVVTYELLTGTVPYSGDNLMAVAMTPRPRPGAERPRAPPGRAGAGGRRPREGDGEAAAGSLRVDGRAGRSARVVPRGGSTNARAARQEEDTGIMLAAAEVTEAAARRCPRVRDEPAPTQVAPPRRSGLRVAGVLLLAAVILVGNLLVLEIVFDDGLPGIGGGGDPAPVQMNAVVDFDPYGDGTEHPEAVGRATDRDAATFWTTEEYRQLRQGRASGSSSTRAAASRLSRIVVVSDTPGFTAMILGRLDP